MYGINEFLLLQRMAESRRLSDRNADQQRWIKEADEEHRSSTRRSSRRRWLAFRRRFLLP